MIGWTVEEWTTSPQFPQCISTFLFLFFIIFSTIDSFVSLFYSCLFWFSDITEKNQKHHEYKEMHCGQVVNSFAVQPIMPQWNCGKTSHKSFFIGFLLVFFLFCSETWLCRLQLCFVYQKKTLICPECIFNFYQLFNERLYQTLIKYKYLDLGSKIFRL